MDFRPVASSNIAKIGYDAGTQTLGVIFTSGSRYDYANVPPEVFEDFVNAGSAGQFFAAEIKDQYAFRRAG